MGVLAVVWNFKDIWCPNRWSRAPQSMCRYPRECWGSCLRHLPTAGVCYQHLGASLRLLPTAGVCEQRVGGHLRLLLTTGVCEQRLGEYLRLLLTAGVCEQGLGGYLRLLLTAGVCQPCLSFVLKPAHYSQMCTAKVLNSQFPGNCRFIPPAFRGVFDCHPLLDVKFRNMRNLYNWTA